ncbi:MAG: hypothetical protein IT368_13915, partial [Candidatus Hydrogenedentes bacterium]|nr:hypothetical protein [Candidatus Hydrogenedentota bacterium]
AEQRTWLIDSVIIQEAAQRTWIGSPRIARHEDAPAEDVSDAIHAPTAPPAPVAAAAPRREAPVHFDDEERQPVIATRDTTATDDMPVSREDRARQLLLRARSRKEGRS